MLKIWGRPNSSNVAKVMWAVAELGAPHQRTDVVDRASAGGALTMGGIALGSLVHRWFAAPLDKPPTTALAAWYDRMKARPAFVTHIAAAVR